MFINWFVCLCVFVCVCVFFSAVFIVSVSFQGMKELGRRVSPDVKQIDVDVLRTFRDHIMYRERYGIKQQALFHLLVAYSMYNPVSPHPN